MIWCICQVLVTLEADRYDSAAPEEAMSASMMVPAQPLD